MTPEIYEIWREAWQREHPHQTPPTNEQVNSLIELLDLDVKEILGI